MMGRKFAITLMFSILQSIATGQQDTPFKNNPTQKDTTSRINRIKAITAEASYVGDFAGNFLGGNGKGTVYLGKASIFIEFGTKDIGLWNDGHFFINGVSTHGKTPSRELFGDFQTASNIEAGNRTYLHEFWYKHSFNNTEFKFGLQDLNSEFLISENAVSFLNSSFGVPSLVSNNMPVPIFPLTALGITGKFQISESLNFQVALFDGMPESFDINQYNLDWSLSKDDGALIFSEFQFSSGNNGLNGTVKIGGYYHTKLKTLNDDTGIREVAFNNNYGFYFIADQFIWNNGSDSSIGVFTQLAISPKEINNHYYYIGCGIVYNGLFSLKSEDLFGVGLAHAGLNDHYMGNETTIEVFYRTPITENFFIQPDLQYIINPAGADNKVGNALAAFIRFGINY